MIQYRNVDNWKLINYQGHDIKGVYSSLGKVWPTIPSVYKWLATYNGGSVSYADCDGTSAITSNEITPLADLVDVQIGDCVRTIGDNAFFYDGYRCFNLSSVTIPNSVQTIGTSAFTLCTGLTSITIPNSVRTIGDCAFYVDWSVRSLTLGSGLTSIGGLAFAGLSQITSLDIPDSVTSIGMGAFWSCVSLTSCTIGSGVTTIGDRAFYNFNNISGVTINATTPPTIGANVFDGEDEYEEVIAYTYPIYVPCGSLAAYQSAWSTYASRLQCIPTPTFDGKWKATYTGGSVTSATCDATSAITEHEIVLTNLVKVEIGSCVNSIGVYSFEYCSTLASVDIPNSVTSIGNYVFKNCYSLSSITIPDSVTTIGQYAFDSCRKLSSVTIPDSVTSISDGTFKYCSGLTSCTIGSGVTSIGKDAFSNCKKLPNITIPNNVTSINEQAFYGCSGLTSCTIGSSISSIGLYAFYNCKSLTKLTIEATTPPTLGGYAFELTNNCPIYVPAQSVSAYQSAWSSYSSRIQAIP